LSPKARPDIYVADRTRKTKWVSFYTDRDSNYTLHFDLGSSGFCYTREVLARRPAIGKAIKLQMGTIIWDHPSLRPTALTAHDMDGRFGWDLVEGRTVEINYDKSLLIIRSDLPRLKGYRRLKISFIRSLRMQFISDPTNYFVRHSGRQADIVIYRSSFGLRNY